MASLFSNEEKSANYVNQQTNKKGFKDKIIETTSFNKTENRGSGYENIDWLAIEQKLSFILRD